MGVTILAYLGFFVALACVLLAVGAFVVTSAAGQIQASLPLGEALGVIPGAALGVALLAVAAVLVATSVGLLRRARWAWIAAIFLVALSAAGDLDRVMRRDAGGLIGLAAVGILVAYLFRGEVRAWFSAR